MKKMSLCILALPLLFPIDLAAQTSGRGSWSLVTNRFMVAEIRDVTTFLNILTRSRSLGAGASPEAYANLDVQVIPRGELEKIYCAGLSLLPAPQQQQGSRCEVIMNACRSDTNCEEKIYYYWLDFFSRFGEPSDPQQYLSRLNDHLQIGFPSTLQLNIRVFPWLDQLTEGPVEASILTQKGGSANILAWSQQSPDESDDLIENEYLEGKYLGGHRSIWSLGYYPGEKILLHADGRLGGCIEEFSTLQAVEGKRVADLKTLEGVIGGTGAFAELSSADPQCSDDWLQKKLPVPCPHLASSMLLYEGDSIIPAEVVSNPTTDWFDACNDPLNNPPFYTWNRTDAPFTYDHRNILKIDKVRLTYDWEGADFIMGTDKTTLEDRKEVGGVYSNLHYSVMPCSNKLKVKYGEFFTGLLKFDNPQPGALAVATNHLFRCPNQGCDPVRQRAYEAMQFLLHVGHEEGAKLQEFDPVDLPPVQVHSLLPGPFWTKKAEKTRPDTGSKVGFDQCEWLDTASLAPTQELRYRNFGIWDWDSFDSDCVAILIYEGDGGSTTLARGLKYIGDTDIADDFVGIFEVYRAETVGGRKRTLYNYTGELSLELTTDDTVCLN